MKGREPRVELKLEPRPEWLCFLLVIHALALAALFLAGLGLIVRALLGIAIIISLSRQLATHWRRTTPRTIRAIVWHGDGRWELTDNRAAMAGVLTDYYLGGWLVVLKFQYHPAVLLWSGRATIPAVRRLRARLRHGRVELARSSPRRGRASDVADTVTMRGNP